LDEYQGLSYKKDKFTPIKVEPQETDQNKKKKSIDTDFRIKYKTEKCKFWEVNKVCKYGDNVYIIVKVLVCICSRNRRC
jgi:hypothetical protein